MKHLWKGTYTEEKFLYNNIESDEFRYIYIRRRAKVDIIITEIYGDYGYICAFPKQLGAPRSNVPSNRSKLLIKGK